MNTRNHPAPWLGERESLPRQAHSTKAGPGRRHKDGSSHGGAAPKSKGAPFGFVLHTNPVKNKRRAAIVAAGGIRQFKRQGRAARSAA